MKIIISRPHLKLFFWVPTSFFRWKWIWKKIVQTKEYVKYDEIDVLIPFIFKGIKNYIKQNGHFYLVKIVSREGTKVKIKV